MIIARKFTALAAGVGAFLAAPAAYAQSDAFAGAYAGPLVGAIEHHFYIEETDLRTGGTQGSYYRDWDIGGGAMAGYDWAVTDRLRLGGELSLLAGGGSPEASFDGARFQQNVRFGYRATARMGLVAGDRAMFFVKAGYGGDRFDIVNQAEISGASNWSSSFVVGAGAQFRLSSDAELRLEVEHLDNSSHAVLVGLPIRF